MFSHGAIRVDLEGFASIKQILRKIFQKLQIFLEKDPEEEDVINFFRQQTYDNRNFLIIFDNFELLQK